MTAASLVIKQAARDDVRDISDYIAFDSPRSAEKFRSEFTQAVERIRAFPQIGHRLEVTSVDLRMMRVSSRFKHYLIVYRVLRDVDVKVARVLHSAIDMTAQLSNLDSD